MVNPVLHMDLWLSNFA